MLNTTVSDDPGWHVSAYVSDCVYMFQGEGVVFCFNFIMFPF